MQSELCNDQDGLSHEAVTVWKASCLVQPLSIRTVILLLRIQRRAHSHELRRRAKADNAFTFCSDWKTGKVLGGC